MWVWGRIRGFSQKVDDTLGTRSKEPSQQPSFKREEAITVEVDVVAEGGHTWIEVKSHKEMDLESEQWLGVPGRMKAG